VETDIIRSYASCAHRAVAVCLVAALSLPFGGAGLGHAQQTVQDPQSTTAPAGAAQPQAPSDGSGSPASGAGQTGQTTPPAAASQTLPGAPKPESSAPVGTAVAPYEKGVGVAASRPAGAVIAPAKQRRTRSFVIKVGLLVGAAVAVGTVVALSSASPSRPH